MRSSDWSSDVCSSDLDINPDHQPDADSAGDSAEAAEAAAAAPGVHSDPVWFGGADAYEISVPASVASIDVHLVRPEEQERVVVEEVGRASCRERGCAYV